MKCTIFISLIFALTQATLLTASIGDTLTSVKPETKETKSKITLIPGKQLNLKVSEDNKLLVVDLQGSITEDMEWILYQPQGDVFARVKTDKNIDGIVIENLAAGTYKLMIKDSSGRVLHKSFEKA